MTYKHIWRLRCGASVSALLLASLTVATPAIAQERAQAATSFNVPRASVQEALRQFAEKTGLQIVYASELAKTGESGGVSGNLTPDAALARILTGTGLSFRYVNATTIVISAQGSAGADDGERVLGAVRIEGAQGYTLPGATSVNGINGSRDVTATEGTGSYTTGAMTIGSKAAASIKEVPASVSVLTNAQIQDQNITGIRGAMEKLPGVIAVNNGDTAHPTFYSRGFQITTFQIDGGAGMRTTSLTGNGGNRDLDSRGGVFVPQMDMSIYDHVEIIRGAAGTFNGFGDPGGVINLVRKKPLDHLQVLGEVQLGSYSLRRASLDISSPLAFNGALRGRLVLTHQDNDFFYDVVHQNKNLAYGIVELDASPTTLVSVGGSYDHQDGGVWQRGLMRYADGNPLPLPRSTCLCLPWAFFNTKTTEGFAQVEQKIGPKWNFKYKFTYQRQIQDGNSPYIDSYVLPDDPDNLVYLTYNGSSHTNPRRWMHEATFDGSFRFLGQDQKIVAGANLVITDGKGTKVYYPNTFPSSGGYSMRINVLKYNPYDPTWSDPGIAYTAAETLYDTEKSITAFMRADLSPLAGLHINTSVNFTHSDYKQQSRYLCRPIFVELELFGCDELGKPLPDGTFSSNFKIGGRSNFSWPPNFSLRYDITNNLSVYGTYADIYVDQSTFLRRDRTSLNPITGKNFEGGLKWNPDNGRLNANVSGYYTQQRNFAYRDCHESYEEDDGTPLCDLKGGTIDTGHGEAGTAITSCCFKDDPNFEKISYGADFDINGRVSRNLNIALNYTYNMSYYKSPAYIDEVSGNRKPLQSFSPRHLYKLSASYSFDQGSTLSGSSVYFGFQGQSVTFATATPCIAYGPDNDGDGFLDCTAAKTVHFTDPGHITFNLGGSIKLDSHFNLQFNIENLLDKTYFAQVGILQEGNWYGAPRNFAITLRGKF
jgi:outer-membrane receptor for ferric coprogen and ferric-rhodotorulic acid